ncbi:GNAT family N-acetyltransferase [Phenylobacterium sp.]|uniref:GNAT family N-acetyltransferase n=1 Tax=Phenylobacterium sp. TaxID=1871053 RepID=UPI0035B0415E
MGALPRLETKRLVLRAPEQSDLDAWAEMLGHEGARFIGGPMSRPEAWRVLALMRGHWDLKGFGLFSILERETGACVGRAGCWSPEAWPGTEVGWALTPAAMGKSYATEASRAAISWAFETLGWTEVIHCIHPDNTASIATAERLGSRHLRTARLPAPFNGHETLIYGQTRESWTAQGV